MEAVEGFLFFWLPSVIGMVAVDSIVVKAEQTSKFQRPVFVTKEENDVPVVDFERTLHSSTKKAGMLTSSSRRQHLRTPQ